MAEPERLSEIFSEVVELASALGVERINQLHGCWERELGDGWFLAVNGHGDEIACSRGARVSPFTAYFERHGMTAALIGPSDGFAVGRGVEDEILSALKRAQAEVRA